MCKNYHKCFLFVEKMSYVCGVKITQDNNMEEKMYTYKYPHPAVTTDCVIFGFDGMRLQVLLVERGLEPCKGKWAFPGGFVKIDESCEDGALRELE